MRQSQTTIHTTHLKCAHIHCRSFFKTMLIHCTFMRVWKAAKMWCPHHKWEHIFSTLRRSFILFLRYPFHLLSFLLRALCWRSAICILKNHCCCFCPSWTLLMLHSVTKCTCRWHMLKSTLSWHAILARSVTMLGLFFVLAFSRCWRASQGGRTLRSKLLQTRPLQPRDQLAELTALLICLFLTRGSWTLALLETFSPRGTSRACWHPARRSLCPEHKHAFFPHRAASKTRLGSRRVPVHPLLPPFCPFPQLADTSPPLRENRGVWGGVGGRGRGHGHGA